ncbi:MAG: hypothetical protein PHV32_12120 [Eubacteriales bacterium]|nr:hypothetical protein [Eubacteriales bacterium]
MGKIITIWGSPNSGKTTLSVKLARFIYEKYNAIVTVVCADEITPALPVIFPNKKADEIFSIGTPLSKPDITQNEVIKNIVTNKNMSNLGFLGFKDGENRFTYPAFDKDKVEFLLMILKNLADVVIVDCTSNIQDVMTVTALKMADTVIRIATPDMKSVSFYSSQLPLMSDPKYKRDEHIVCMNTTDNSVFTPVSEAVSHFNNIAFSFSFCQGIKNQYMNGTLLEKFSDKKWDSAIKALAEKVAK